MQDGELVFRHLPLQRIKYQAQMKRACASKSKATSPETASDVSQAKPQTASDVSRGLACETSLSRLSLRQLSRLAQQAATEQLLSVLLAAGWTIQAYVP